MRPLFALVVALTSTIAAAQDLDADGEAQMLARINAERAAANLAPLERSAELDAVARSHSTEMAARATVEHVSPVTGTPADRVASAGIRATTIMENVAMHRDTSHAFDALIGSPGHRSNMMGAEITHVGLASVRSPQGVYVTQVFARITPPAPVVEERPAPAPQIVEEEEPASIFQIIPPFVETLIDAAAAAQAPAAVAPVAPEAVAATPAAPVAQPAPASATQPAPASAAPAQNGERLPRQTEDALRQIFGLAQSLLGGAVTVE